MSKRKQFESMQEGDKVWVESNRSGWSVETFKRTTKTLLVTTFRGQERKYDIDTGSCKGTDRWSFIDASPFTSEHQVIVDTYKLNEGVKDSLETLKGNYKKLTNEDLSVLLTLVDKCKEG